MKALLEQLSVLAKIKGLTQQQIADSCGISRISVNRFFNGKTELAYTDFVKLLGLLDIDVQIQVERKLECRLSGDKTAESPVYSDVAVILENLEQPVRQTLIEQITWWGQLLPKKSLQSRVDRVRSQIQDDLKQVP